MCSLFSRRFQRTCFCIVLSCYAQFDTRKEASDTFDARHSEAVRQNLGTCVRRFKSHLVSGTLCVCLLVGSFLGVLTSDTSKCFSVGVRLSRSGSARCCGLTAVCGGMMGLCFFFRSTGSYCLVLFVSRW